MNPTSTGVHARTPSIRVIDNRHLVVREINYHRSARGDTAQTQIMRHRYSNAGRLSQSIDPRLHALQEGGGGARPNLLQHHTLSGLTVRTDSVDAGTSLWLHDSVARVVLSVNAGGVKETRSYDPLSGRLLSLTEQRADSAPEIVQRWMWGDSLPASRAGNLAGQCVKHYHAAGLTTLASASIMGHSLNSVRTVLADDEEADWRGSDEAEWIRRMADGEHSTLSTFDATGALLSLRDARGNRQRIDYGVCGNPLQSWMTAADQESEQAIIKSTTYSAAGQKLVEEHGNGVVTRNTYDDATHRLVATQVSKAESQSRMRSLRDLRYQYDPIGMVLEVNDAAQPARFWRNQQVLARQTYAYDSLYRLIHATGRECAAARLGSINAPAGAAAVHDDVTYTNYSRAYRYDDGNNLVQVRHVAPASNNSHTIDMVVSDRSNRALPSSWSATPQTVDVHFLPGGQQRWLQVGQPLNWNGPGLLAAVAASGDGADALSEWYRYDSPASRVLKVTNQAAGRTLRQRRVHYLPELEIRQACSDGSVTSLLQVATSSLKSTAQIQLQRWEVGRPEGVEDCQYRYLYSEITRSVGLELDGQGAVVSQEEYYPFGGTAWAAGRSEVDASSRTLRYSGKERDATGLYYFGYRYYQAALGRWLSADPAGDIDGLNMYAMVRNDPVNLRDAEGLVGESTIAQRIAALKLNSGASASSASATPTPRPTPAASSARPGIPPRPQGSVGVASKASAPAIATPIASPPPPVAVASSAPAAVAGKKHFTLYRGDNRTWGEMAEKYPQGFTAWVPLKPGQSRQLAKSFLGNNNTTDLPPDLTKNMLKWGGAPKLADLSTYIKYTKDRTTVWISTAVNTEAGGQSSGSPLYEINMDLYEFKIVRNQLVPMPEGRQKNMEFSLLLDTPDIESANIIALNHGPVNDAEISFLTRIPFETLKEYKRG